MRSTTARLALWLLLSIVGMSIAHAQSMSAVIQKPSVAVHGAPDFSAPTVATLQRNAAVKVSGQQGLWFAIEMPAGKSGYVRVNDVRMAYAGKEGSSANVRALFAGKAG